MADDTSTYSVPAFQNSLQIFKTDADKYGLDVAKMSDFFGGYVQQMSLALKDQSDLEVVRSLPVADIEIINDVVHQADVVLHGGITLLPDFDNLPSEIKSNLKKGVYKIGESRQVDGNLRAVILDENGVRIKDITLKKVSNNPHNIETVRSIGNQLQMRQIYASLENIRELQEYQIEKDRDRDIIVPFLDARSLVVEAEKKNSQEEREKAYKEADSKIMSALNAVYVDIETTTKELVKRTHMPFGFGRTMNIYMGYLTRDLEIATKYVGVRMQILEHLGERKMAQDVLQLYQHVMYNFLTKAVAKNGESAAMLMHDYFPYDETNQNCWYSFRTKMEPVLRESIQALEIGAGNKSEKEIYIVSAEDAKDE